MMQNQESAEGAARTGRLILVTATWDPEASVWVAQSEDIPLVTEAPTVEALNAKLPGIIQDLLEDEDSGSETDVSFRTSTHRML
jgi:hypothetical protein